MSSILEYYGMSPVKTVDAARYYSKQPVPTELITSDRVVGIEVEVENWSLKHDPAKVWQRITDGSLRNNGVEYITYPIAAKWTPYALQDLLGNAFSDECCFSPRTSTHIHVNCQDLKTVQVIDILLLYAALEPFFYQFAGRGRSKNIYCVPLQDAEMVAFAANRDLNVIVQSWSKYTGFNLLPLAEKGTLEFRHMHGTFNHTKLSVWIRLILKLFDYVLVQGTGNIRKLVRGLNGNSDVIGLMIDVFGDDSRQFNNMTYATIKDAVEITRQAFMKPEKNGELLNARTTKSLYFKGV
jgi:hypothetical protein